VNATGGGEAPGIDNSSDVTISGGDVTATGGQYAAGIGDANGGTVSLTGGIIKAARGADGIYDIGNSTTTLNISGTAAVLLRNNSCVTPLSLPDGHSLTATDGEVYGAPCAWTGTFGGYLRLYTLSYDINGGSGTAPVSVTQHAGTACAVEGDSGFSFLAGYNFDGWNTAANGSGTSYTPVGFYTFSGNGTLYAQWAYTVAYDANGGTGSTASSTHLYNASKALTLNGFTKTNYVFAGWAESATGDVVYTNGQSVMNLPTAERPSVTLYAKWTLNTYTVAYNANGGAGSTSSSTHTYGIPKNLTMNGFARAGHEFAGWAESSAGAVKYTDGQSVTNLTSTNGATVTLYAKWTQNTFTVTFDPKEGSAVPPVDYTYGSAVYAPSAPVRSGHNFTGWYYNTECTSPVSFPFTMTGNITLYAGW
ncbi:MAG: InlB B-repeat-containing protein, partial [Bacillota bacterium]